MKALAFTVAAAVDLEEDWDHTEGEWGLAQARRYAQELRDTFHELASEQRRGARADMRPGYLKCRSGAHVIFFATSAIRWRSSAFCTARRTFRGICDGQKQVSICQYWHMLRLAEGYRR